MGQSEIIEFLIMNPNRWFTSKEIYTALNKRDSMVPLKRLRGHPIEGLVFKKEGRRYLYKYISSE